MSHPDDIWHEHICLNCGELFRVWRYQHRQGAGLYCSVRCRYQPRPLLPLLKNPNIVQVPLSKGKTALIDASDTELVGKFNWCAIREQKRDTYRVMTRFKGKNIYLHRMLMNPPRGVHIDHRNRNPLDNRRGNLRFATVKQNRQNMRRRSTNTSGYIGVSFQKKDGKWRAAITQGPKCIVIGTFDNPEEAAHAYDDAARSLRGEFARTNFRDK